jgi:prepilin-type N-terminal cleavage/methylation domain-containing protein/prepilin-type processing-associated H-X9-DG protein
MSTPWSHTNARSRAFTLIELLVVIAIIAILAAILFPVFAKAREKARQASCMSNVKQIGLGLLQYYQDYDEVVPQVAYGIEGTCGSNWNQAVSWRTMIYPYVKNAQVFACPSNPSKSLNTLDTPLQFPVSYVGNWNFHYQTGMPLGMFDYPGCGRLSLGGVQLPAQTINIVEIWSYQAPEININWPGYGPLLYAGHTGTTNYEFADGHVKALRPAATDTNWGTPSEVNMWYNDGSMLRHDPPYPDAVTTLQIAQSNPAWQ